MRALFTAVLTLTLLVGRSGRPEEQNAPVEGPPDQHTTVRGTLPADLEGHWLTLASVDLPNQQGVALTLSTWEISRERDQLVLKVSLSELPSEPRKHFEEASNSKQAWRPSAEDLAQIGAAWGTGPDLDPHLASIESEIIGPDGFDDDLKRDPNTRDALWVVRQRQNFRPSAAPNIRHIYVYSALQPKDGGWVGNFSTGTIAGAPLPISLAFNGTFQAFRLGAAPVRARGLLARLADLFAGCGRR